MEIQNAVIYQGTHVQVAMKLYHLRVQINLNMITVHL